MRESIVQFDGTMSKEESTVRIMLKKLVKFKDNTKKSVARLKSAEMVGARLELLERTWNDFSTAWNEWELKDDEEKTDDISDDDHDTAEAEYVMAKGELYAMMTAITGHAAYVGAAAPVQAQVANGAQGNGNNIRMKAIDAPTFSGELESWVSFRDLFRSVVITNHALSDIQRLQYLRTSCQGKAAELIEGIELAAGNFNVAWEALTHRYENERLLISRMIERLLDVPKMTRECPNELARLLDGTNQCLRSLVVMKRPTDGWDDWLVVQTTRKLDFATRQAWEKSIAATTEMPTFRALNEYLSGVMRAFEAVKGLNKATNMTRSVTNKTAHTHVIATGSKGGCFMCNGAHGLYNCEAFRSQTVDARRAFAESKHLCFNCLSTTNHGARHCNSRYKCRECQQNHHTLLHEPNSHARQPQQEPANATNESSRVRVSHVCQSTPVPDPKETMLPTAWVTVVSQGGRLLRMRALIDQASQVSVISRPALQRLGLKWNQTDIALQGVGESDAGKMYGCVRFAIAAGEKSEHMLDVRALVLASVTADLPNVSVMKSAHPLITSLQLADEQYWQSGRIDLLLGAPLFYELLLEGVRKADGLIAQETVFGWMLTGSAVSNKQSTTAISCVTQVQLDGLLRRFWEQEETEQKRILSDDDAMCEAIYNRTTKRGDDGRYIVELPFRQGGRELGVSQNGAVRRLQQMERRGEQYPQMYEGYKQFMATYLNLGHMEAIPADQIDTHPHCYLPHHAVFKPESTSTKLRVVFDATASTANGKGLNDYLLIGPRLQETLNFILMRWRLQKIAISADIEKMYRQIWVAPAHRDYQRIVWREQKSDEIQHFRLKTVTYGTASAPYVAVKTIQRLAEDERHRFPLAAHAVLNDFYVDDCLSGANTVEKAMELKEELLRMMEAGGLRLLKWSSNSSELLQSLPAEYIECRAPLLIDEDSSTNDSSSIKALGIHWHPASDEFGFKVNQAAISKSTTKRQVLSEIAKLFDPLGFLAPVIITAKTMMQQLWMTGLAWDDVLPDEVCAKWHAFQQQLVQLEKVRVKRWCGFNGRECAMQLHGFSDASQIAYAACVYVRVEQPDGSITVTLLTAKTKVAPVKQQSIPRLELNGAVLLARLMADCRQALRCPEVIGVAWTDSMVVLAWLRRHANIWPTFVANRVSEIQSTMNLTCWRHVPGEDNPADVASRGIMPAQIREHALWWAGPTWLRSESSCWPQQTPIEVDDGVLEKKKTVSCQVVQSVAMCGLTRRFSTLRRLLRVTAYCRRMMPCYRSGELTLNAAELEAARLVWVRQAQCHDFGNVSQLVQDGRGLQKKQLHKLNPFVDDKGIMRVGGRLVNAALGYEERHPAILMAKNDVAQLIITDAHERVFHSGPQNTSNYIHQRYWLLNERREVRKVVHRCVTCAKSRPKVQQQLMGDLPAARVRVSRPFLHTAMDFAGPIWSRTTRGRGQKAHKSWIAVFVCLNTKATHLELVSELSTAAFIAAFRRFISRRGLCAHVYCDNGTNFVGANREMREQLATCVRDEQWRMILADSGTTYHFSPPGSPHFNGLAEATVRMAKTAMRKVIGDTKLTFEEMSTFLSQVEAALNSRPLCAVPSDGNDINALTPGHFLVGQPLTAVPEPDATNERLATGDRWHLVQQLTQHFWRRWSREYLHQLQQRTKWAAVKRNVKVGDIVLVHDELLHCTKWKMGRVVETHPGEDGHVRVVSIRTATGTLKRAIVKVSVLPINDDNDMHE